MSRLYLSYSCGSLDALALMLAAVVVVGWSRVVRRDHPHNVSSPTHLKFPRVVSSIFSDMSAGFNGVGRFLVFRAVDRPTPWMSTWARACLRV